MLCVLIFIRFSVYLQYSLANEKNKSSNIWILKILVVSLLYNSVGQLKDALILSHLTFIYKPLRVTVHT